MPSFLFQVSEVHGTSLAPSPEDSSAQSPSGTIESLASNGRFLDYTLSWLERRSIEAVLPSGQLDSLTFDVRRSAFVRYDSSLHLLMTHGLRSPVRAGQLLWPSSRVSFRQTSFDLGRLLHQAIERGVMYSDIENVTVDDLPVGSVPAASLIVRSCSMESLEELTEGTSARVRQATMQPVFDSRATVTLSCRGSFRVSGAFDEPQLAVNVATELFNSLSIDWRKGHAG